MKRRSQPKPKRQKPTGPSRYRAKKLRQETDTALGRAMQEALRRRERES